MSFDTINCFSLDEAPSMFPQRPSVETIKRWIRLGLPGPKGERIVLQSYRIGRRRFITRDAIETFIRDLNPDHAGDGSES